MAEGQVATRLEPFMAVAIRYPIETKVSSRRPMRRRYIRTEAFIGTRQRQFPAIRIAALMPAGPPSMLAAGCPRSTGIAAGVIGGVATRAALRHLLDMQTRLEAGKNREPP